MDETNPKQNNKGMNGQIQSNDAKQTNSVRSLRNRRRLAEKGDRQRGKWGSRIANNFESRKRKKFRGEREREREKVERGFGGNDECQRAYH